MIKLKDTAFEPINKNLIDDDFSNARGVTADERKAIKKDCEQKYGSGKDYRDCVDAGKKEEREEWKDMSKQERKEEKKENRGERRSDRKAERKQYKGKGGVLLHITTKFNPLTAVARAGFLMIVRLNMFGLATRLYPAIASESELKAKKYKKSYIDKIKKDFPDKIKPLYYKIGGKGKSLEEAIAKGITRKPKAYRKGRITTKSVSAMSSEEMRAMGIAESTKDSKLRRKEKKSNISGSPVVEGFPYQAFIVKPVVEPFNSLKPQYIDLDEGYSNTAGSNKPTPESKGGAVVAGASAGVGALAATGTAVAGLSPQTLALISAGIALAGGVIAKLPSEKPFEDGSEEGDEYDGVMDDSENPQADQNALNSLEDSAKSDVEDGGDPDNYSGLTKKSEDEISEATGDEKPFFKTPTGIAILVVGGIALLVGGYFLVKKLKK